MSDPDPRRRSSDDRPPRRGPEKEEDARLREARTDHARDADEASPVPAAFRVRPAAPPELDESGGH